jgi:hypothetical protein
MYDGGHGADQLPESLDWPGFAGDVDAPVRPGEDESGQGLGGRGDRDVGRCGRGFRGEGPLVAVAFSQVVRTVEPEVPAGWFVVVGGEVDGLGDGAEQMLGVQRLAGLRPASGVS